MADKPAPKKKTPKKKGRKPVLDPELVAAAIAKLDGNLSAVARRFDVHRSSVQELVGNRPSLQKALSDAREGMLDEAESSLYRAVKGGQAWAVCFFLKTQGKCRGYTEKPDDDAGKDKGAGGVPVELVTRLFALLGAQPGGTGDTPGGGPVDTQPGAAVPSVPERSG
jgi:hypothetical protein